MVALEVVAHWIGGIRACAVWALGLYLSQQGCLCLEGDPPFVFEWVNLIKIRLIRFECLTLHTGVGLDDGLQVALQHAFTEQKKSVCSENDTTAVSFTVSNVLV